MKKLLMVFIAVMFSAVMVMAADPINGPISVSSTGKVIVKSTKQIVKSITITKTVNAAAWSLTVYDSASSTVGATIIADFYGLTMPTNTIVLGFDNPKTGGYKASNGITVMDSYAEGNTVSASVNCYGY